MRKTLIIFGALLMSISLHAKDVFDEQESEEIQFEVEYDSGEDEGDINDGDSDTTIGNGPMQATSESQCKEFGLLFYVEPCLEPEEYEILIELTTHYNSPYLIVDLAGVEVEEQGDGSVIIPTWTLNVTNVMTGQTMLTQNVNGTTTQFPINGWPSGLYTVSANYNGIVYSRKIRI